MFGFDVAARGASTRNPRAAMPVITSCNDVRSIGTSQLRFGPREGATLEHALDCTDFINHPFCAGVN
jgi:hypothetical protein